MKILKLNRLILGALRRLNPTDSSLLLFLLFLIALNALSQTLPDSFDRHPAFLHSLALVLVRFLSGFFGLALFSSAIRFTLKQVLTLNL
ncbi:MAG: hypothetical protein QXT02_06100 [Candidatus Hadarchaeum sp.]